MMKMDLQLLKNVESYALGILQKDLSLSHTYHNLDHTEKVVEVVEEIARNSGLGEEELYILKLAAWFHDVGYLNSYEKHEDESIKIARKFLQAQKVDQELIEKVCRLIEVTELKNIPENLSEEIMKDADMFHLGSPNGLGYTDEIRKEWEHFRNESFTDEQWDKLNYKFYKSHTYYTEYAKEKFAEQKNENILFLKKKVKKAKNKRKKNLEKKGELTRSALEIQLISAEEKLVKTKQKLRKSQKLRPDRGIETMFRSTYRTHISLSAIADNKANILLTVSTLLMGVIFTEVIQKSDIDDLAMDSFIAYPLISFIVVCMATIIFAILATRPKVNSGIFTREDILQKKTNLLFFGNYHGMPLDDYMWGVDEMMKDADYLYGSMTKDLFFLGKVLAKKFQYLRIAYNIFMYGIGLSLVLAAIMFVIAARSGV